MDMKPMAMLKAIWGYWMRAVYFLFTRISVLLVFFVGLYWTYVVFASLKEDTTTITNAAFAVAATLAALSFSCARAVTDSVEASDRFTYAGERFLHGAVMLLCASLLKYAYLRAESSGLLDSRILSWTVLTEIIGIMVGVLFFWALSSAHGGLIVLNKLLWTRFNRYPDWDDFM
jgi:hypothetical protein